MNRTLAVVEAWLRQAGYVPTNLQISALQRLGGRMFRANVAFDDHPGGERVQGKIDVVSVKSVAEFIQRVDTGSTISTLSLTASPEHAR